jgi:dihydrofolate reductase
MQTSVFIGISLDGFIARPDGAIDWLVGAGEPGDFGYHEFFASVDALVMGRNTYELVLTFDPWPYGEKPVYVLTTRPLPEPTKGPDVVGLRGEPAEVMKQLEARGVRHAYVDGGVTIQRFLRAGLIDRMTISRLPVLIGEGIPLFGPTGRDIRLTHVATKTYDGGMVQSVYDVVKE